MRKRFTFLRDPKLQCLLAVLNAHGQARVNGGAIRNALLKRKVADVDISTTLVPEQVTELCKAAGFGVYPTGVQHGTLTITVEHQPFEVTTLRRDVETDGRHAVVAFTTDWEQDALRRDFTMNAMYCDEKGNIYDFTNGYKDCLNQKVKFVGLPSRRIREDALRILRFFRFHAIYGKGKLDAKGLAACTRARKTLGNLSVERIRAEILKLLAATDPTPTLKVMTRVGILGEVLPHGADWKVIAHLPPDPLLRLYALASEPLELPKRFKLSKREADRIAALAAAEWISPELTPHEQMRLIYQLGKSTWLDAITLGAARNPGMDRAYARMRRLANEFVLPVFPINGQDITAAGVETGPRVGQQLAQLEEWWLASDFKPTREELLRRISRYT